MNGNSAFELLLTTLRAATPAAVRLTCPEANPTDWLADDDLISIMEAWLKRPSRNIKGLYFILYEHHDGLAVAYIGQGDLRDRLLQHFRNPQTIDQLLAVEMGGWHGHPHKMNVDQRVALRARLARVRVAMIALAAGTAHDVDNNRIKNYEKRLIEALKPFANDRRVITHEAAAGPDSYNLAALARIWSATNLPLHVDLKPLLEELIQAQHGVLRLQH